MFEATHPFAHDQERIMAVRYFANDTDCTFHHLRIVAFQCFPVIASRIQDSNVVRDGVDRECHHLLFPGKYGTVEEHIIARCTEGPPGHWR